MRNSAAYDLSQFSPAPQKPQVRVVRTGSDEKRARTVFGRKMVAYCIVITMLLTYTVYSKIDTGTKSLTVLESENAYLSCQLESMVSLKNAEDYAVSQLGLVKFDSSQIEYVNLQNDNAITSSEKTNSIASGFQSLVDDVLELLKG
ncbi:MAG: hypothetical protein RSE36_05030 [Oscillospiraceae bacterium]